MRAHLHAVFVLVLTLGGCADAGSKPPSATELTTMLQSQDPNVQIEAANWVKQMGPQAAETRPALVVALKSPNATVRQSAAMALGKIGPEAAEAVPALTAALSDTEYSVQSAAAAALGELGPAASSAIPALENLSKQADPCSSGSNALKKIRQ